MDKEKRMRIEVGNILKSLGIYPNLTGYRYMAELVIIGQERDILPITKVGYPLIVEKFETTPQRIDSAIRHAIQIGMKKVPHSEWEKILNISFTTKLTNTEVISMLVENISYENFD